MRKVERSIGAIRGRGIVAGLGLLTLMAGCSTEDDAAPKSASATLAPTGALAARGTVVFTVAAGGVRVQASLQGLPPGLHGFHVHEKGSCDSAGAAAGGHFNPEGHVHGLPDSAAHHMGDLGNLTAGTDSVAVLDKIFPYLTLEGANTVQGRGLIVHAAPDNGGQPTGNAGGRISCAVIGMAK